MNVAVRAVQDGVAIDIADFDGGIAGLRIQGAVNASNPDTAVGAFQARRTGRIVQADGTVGRDQAADIRTSRHLDDKARAEVVAALGRPDYMHRHRVRAVVDGDLERIRSVLGGSSLGATDIHGGLVPGGYFHRSVKSLQ